MKHLAFFPMILMVASPAFASDYDKDYGLSYIVKEAGKIVMGGGFSNKSKPASQAPGPYVPLDNVKSGKASPNQSFRYRQAEPKVNPA